MAQREKSVSIPISVLMTAHSLDEVEDWLEANSPEFVEALSRFREAERLLRDGRPFAQVKKKWKIKEH